MIPYKTFSTVELGFLKLHVWGLFVAIGFLVGIFLAAREARRRKLDHEIIYDVAPWIILGSIIGARLVFLIENPWAVTGFIDIVSVWKGGMAFHGGFFGALIAGLIFVKRRKIRLWKYADAAAPSIAIGHAIGRVGCFVTGLHIGKETSVPWAVMYEGKLRHSTPLYELIALIGIFAALMWLRKRKVSGSFDGFLFAAYVALYSLARFFIEFFRTDPTYLGFTIAQYIVAVLFAASAGIIVKKFAAKRGRA
ncbi:prolipoprotein diacylglyceryl transferase [Candidatus Woesearchaeota archaeon]|nr:prolipoprotein diacylglyceryl transferase [Candidatus Woesearchaeota archaeon]